MSQADFKRRLKALMLRPENQVCSDCPERQPRWASLIKPPPGAPPGSLAIGAFCCLECSGSHRRLGVHISFVRSVNLDQWKEQEVLAMENGGNQKVNAIFEANLNVSKPTTSATGPVRERFIRDKYERRKFYDPSVFDRVSQMEREQEQEEVVNGVQRRLASNRKPSDAAKARVAERAARNRVAGGGGGSAVRSTTRTAKTKAPRTPTAPAPPPVDLLDFGDFGSAEATSGVQASVVTANTISAGNAAPAPPTAPPAAPATSNKEPELDLFANMSSGNIPGGGGGNGQMQQQPGQPHQEQVQQPDQKKMTNADIMSMFTSPSAQHNPMQQNMFAMGGGGVPKGNNNMAMMNNMGGGGMPNNNMAMMNNMNPQQQMGMMNNMQMMQMQNMMAQQGMGGNSMGGNMNMGMMGGQGMGNNMGGGGMMMQQQPQMNNMQMMQGGGGGMMPLGGSQYGQQSRMMGGQTQAQGQNQQRGGNANQFSDFANFGR
eukprot:CAMPEP_0181100852 /NCGR_PEP_ID=MMETSP1071-20121207/13422_1 /TAXON_ID=35127 /ORGANISM="Thalassiosira sp., Strain NH16" /LENGTH=486 /DNA_ID=CAMNT_0023183625 /DNA_START=146 /DNA_END=1606 /DNA_ORIENTATION=+